MSLEKRSIEQNSFENAKKKRKVYDAFRILLKNRLNIDNTENNVQSGDQWMAHGSSDVSSQKLGAEKTDHLDEFRLEAPSFPDDQHSQTSLPQNIEKIRSSSDNQDKLIKLADKLTQPGVVTRLQERNQMQLLGQVNQAINEWEFLNTLRLEAADKSIKLAYILEEAKPKLSNVAKICLNQLKNIQKNLQQDQGNSRLSNQYIKFFRRALQELSPETMQEYNLRKVKFVPKEGDNYLPFVGLVGENKLEIPTRYSDPLALLRYSVGNLHVEYQQDKVLPSLKRRLEVAATVFKVNALMGKEYGRSTRGYEMAKEYEKYYYEGIRKAFEEDSINIKTPADQLRKIGENYAKQKLIESHTTGQGERKTYPCFWPAHYFEERLRAIKEGHKPVKVGTDEFNQLIKNLQKRKKDGSNSTIIANIMLNGDIWVQPYYISEYITSPHSVNTKGNPCIFSGELDIDIDNNGLLKLIRISDKSGHFRTVDPDSPDPLHILKHAVEAFKAHSFEIAGVKMELAGPPYGRHLPFRLPE